MHTRVRTHAREALDCKERRTDKKGYSSAAGWFGLEVATILPKPGGRVAFAEAGETFPDDMEGLARLL